MLVKLNERQFRGVFFITFFEYKYWPFHEVGRASVLYEFWNIIDKDGAMESANSINILELILSGPGDSLLLRSFSFFKITSEEKLTCWSFVKLACSGKSHSESDSLVNALIMFLLYQNHSPLNHLYPYLSFCTDLLLGI